MRTVPLALLADAISHPWESLRMSLELHREDDLGSTQVEGDAAWHLKHIVETFRMHADHAAPELGGWNDLPDETAALVEMVERDVQRFIAWADAQPEERWTRRFNYGREMDLREMLGVMTRHITWHAAAIHYWVRWRSGEREGTP